MALTLGDICAAEMTRWNDEGRPSLALTLWDKLKLRGDTARPTVSAYNQALRACDMLGDLPLSLALVAELREEPGGLDVYAGGLDWAVRLMSRSRRYLQTLDLFESLSLGRVNLKASSFNILMSELAEVPKWREVVKIMTLMTAYHVRPDSESYCWAITAYLAMGKVNDATRLLAEMGDVGLAPSEAAITRWAAMPSGASGEAGTGGAEEGLVASTAVP